MNTELIQIVSYGMFVFGGFFGMITVFLWFYLDIRGVIADLRGKKAKLEMPVVRRAVETAVLEEQAVAALAKEVTALLNGYRFVINEIVVHTEEEI